MRLLGFLVGKRLSRAGTRGHKLVFALGQIGAGFGVFKRVRTHLTPSLLRE